MSDTKKLHRCVTTQPYTLKVCLFEQYVTYRKYPFSTNYDLTISSYLIIPRVDRTTFHCNPFTVYF